MERVHTSVYKSLLNARVKKYGTLNQYYGAHTKENDILSIRNPYNQVFQQVKTLHQEKEDMLRLVAKDNICTINYEDLVKEPMKEIKKIQRFLKKQNILIALNNIALPKFINRNSIPLKSDYLNKDYKKYYKYIKSMVKKLEIKNSKEDFENLFEFLLKSNFKNITSFTENKNGRLNKKFIFKSENEWKEIIPKDYHKKINLLLSKLKNYKGPFSKEELDFLNRIQVIESKFIKKSTISNKGRHIFGLHCDRINSYKIYMCFSNIKIKDGPIYFANLRQCKKQIMTKINEIEEKEKVW